MPMKFRTKTRVLNYISVNTSPYTGLESNPSTRPGGNSSSAGLMWKYTLTTMYKLSPKFISAHGEYWMKYSSAKERISCF
jgi:hypothetical protein